MNRFVSLNIRTGVLPQPGRTHCLILDYRRFNVIGSQNNRDASAGAK